jgi:hypothetical protein
MLQQGESKHMKTFDNICAQGDVLFQKIDSLPKGLKSVKAEGRSQIITHSETGHHHVMEADKVELFENPSDPMEAFLVVHETTTLDHLRQHDTHEPIQFKPGNYKIHRQREHSPEGFRRVAD